MKEGFNIRIFGVIYVHNKYFSFRKVTDLAP